MLIKLTQGFKFIVKLIPIAAVIIVVFSITSLYLNPETGVNKLLQTRGSMNHLHQRKEYGEIVLVGDRPELLQVSQDQYKVLFKNTHFLGINGIEKRRYAIENFYFVMQRTDLVTFELLSVSNYWLKDVTPDFDVKTTQVIPRKPVYLLKGGADIRTINFNYSLAGAKGKEKLRKSYMADIKSFDEKTVVHLVKTFGDKTFMQKWRSIYYPDVVNKMTAKQFTKAFKQKVGDKYLQDFIAVLNGDAVTLRPHVSQSF
ncbi:hypothetical protein H4J56_18240 [Colwellia sp. BRX8-4]|uniref:hypothetical protein n=1 Tax=Colwellia sp. BRX8-4 TaxID=2759836 RepID=UPI0015F622E5|nr:hypothetical protein [Colwellia sp. BRX8-4]MBA6373359.1 hypothetical protein [Colwellia sp. BRX8-4]